MHYLGLDIGGTKIAAVVMDAHGWEIRRYRCPTQKSTENESGFADRAARL